MDKKSIMAQTMESTSLYPIRIFIMKNMVVGYPYYYYMVDMAQFTIFSKSSQNYQSITELLQWIVRGHGRSEQADTLSFDLMADYYSIMIDLFKLDSVYIIGYSDGGVTALNLAQKRPDKVAKIIASGVNSRMDGINSEVLGYLKLINPAFIETNQKEWLTDYQSKSPEKDKWEKYITDMTRMYSKNVIIDEQTLSNIGAKVLLVFGDRDVVKLEHSFELYRSIAGSQLCVLPNTPHEVFSESPELISNIAIEFLTK